MKEYFTWDDIHYRALNKLKNARTNDNFSGELSMRIDRPKFCDFCLSKNLIRYSTPEEDMELISITECKEFLKKNHLRITGRKADLVQRIFLYDSSFFGSKHYVITETGINTLHKYWELRKLQNNQPEESILDRKLKKYNISLKKYLIVQKELPYSPPINDVVWAILNERTLEYSFNKSYYDLRNNYLNMALLLEEETKYIQALQYFLMVICFDVNGYNFEYQQFGQIGRPNLVHWICDRVYYLRSYYCQSISIVAYSQCQIKKLYCTEINFITLIDDIVNSYKRIDCDKTKELLKKCIGEY